MSGSLNLQKSSCPAGLLPNQNKLFHKNLRFGIEPCSKEITAGAWSGHPQIHNLIPVLSLELFYQKLFRHPFSAGIVKTNLSRKTV